ncbi:MAG TPA: hypothetical protein VGH19_09535 [Verrucomicrobiae bacterium]
MKQMFLSMFVMSAAMLLAAGCGNGEAEIPAPASTTAPSAHADMGVVLVAQPVVPPPPAAGGSPTALGKTALPPADPHGPLKNLVQGGNIFFYDKDDNFLPKDSVDFLEKAIQSYMDTRKYKSDDSPDWPPMTDLSLLVRYKVIRALPAPPAGQQFILDPATRKVSLAAK